MLISILASLPGIVIAMTIHEFGHAFVANLMGDNTAKRAGRMTLDPMKHIDPMGFIMLIIARFGWAKPVPVNPYNFKHERIGSLLVSLAGPLFNIVMAVIAIYISVFLGPFVRVEAFYEVMDNVMWYNIMFAAFNLLPIPPLDGSQIVGAFLPFKYRFLMQKYEGIGTAIMIFLLFTNTIQYVLSPMINMVVSIITRLV